MKNLATFSDACDVASVLLLLLLARPFSGSRLTLRAAVRLRKDTSGRSSISGPQKKKATKNTIIVIMMMVMTVVMDHDGSGGGGGGGFGGGGGAGGGGGVDGAHDIGAGVVVDDVDDSMTITILSSSSISSQIHHHQHQPLPPSPPVYPSSLYSRTFFVFCYVHGTGVYYVLNYHLCTSAGAGSGKAITPRPKR